MRRGQKKNGATFKVILEPSKDGGYAVHVPALRGCHSQGDTVEEALENAQDAISLHIHSLRKQGIRIRQEEPVVHSRIEVSA